MNRPQGKDNSGALFRNEDKKGESHPDYKGTADINGQPFWVSSWIKTSKAGQKYMSLAFTPKQEIRAPKAAPVRDMPDFDDKIGF